MPAIDVFAHILPPTFLREMQVVKPDILNQYPYMKNDLLTDVAQRRSSLLPAHQQILSMVNLNPEDFSEPAPAAKLCRSANNELTAIIRENKSDFPAGVAMLPMNNIDEALKIIDEQVVDSEDLVGVQLFTRALGKPISDPEFAPIFDKLAEVNVPIWLHPVFDDNKLDNELTFSWEYEITQAMNGIVNAGYFREYPQLKIIVHHAGAMVPYFSQRIKYIQSSENYADFQKFYVDTAILGNTKALELAADFFGIDKVLFGTDAPFGVPPIGATKVIEQAVNKMNITSEQVQKIMYTNWQHLIFN